MTFKYSICHINKEDIEYRNSPISGQEVLKIAENYPWVEQLNFCDSINQDEIIYSPSLDFTCISNQQSFGLTADFDDKNQLEFSIWYNRPKKVKVLFGLLGETEKMVVDDFWSLNFKDTLKFLKYFVDGNYKKIEELYNK